ncbi:hypothetical protein ADK41_20530 [Streptomyces caelestis]|uniref:Uncharacterized protein n=1 Tax=Streptomyces caelestis TaxID=36816 RepID=A0A0M8QQN0_9ACTN|nr:hypothetical protein ADK41_20530 [Streptomyces caelestis]
MRFRRTEHRAGVTPPVGHEPRAGPDQHAPFGRTGEGDGVVARAGTEGAAGAGLERGKPAGTCPRPRTSTLRARFARAGPWPGSTTVVPGSASAPGSTARTAGWPADSPQVPDRPSSARVATNG